HAVDVAGRVTGHHRLQRSYRDAVEAGVYALAAGVEPAAAGGVVDHPGHAVGLADGHHHVTRDVDQVADLQVADGGIALGLAILVAEGDAVQCRAHGLRAGVARQQHAEAAVDLGDEATAVAGVVGMAPAIPLAQEFEGLRNQVGL